MKYNYLAAACLLVLICAYSCKKKSNSNPFGGAKIATIDYTHSGGTLHYRVVYDQYSNVDTISWTGDGTSSGNTGYKAFTYFGSSFSITDEYGNSFDVYANTSGQILEVLVPDTLFMHYNGSQLSSVDTKSPTAAAPWYMTTTNYYNWSNGDVASYGPSGAETNAYYYNTSQSGQPGDPMRIDDFIAYGRSYIKTDHLPLGLVTTADTAEQYFYQFDPLGRISGLIRIYAGSTDTAFYNYKYY